MHGYGECSIPAIPYTRKKIANDITRFRSSRAWQRKRSLSTIRNYITLKPQIQRLSTNETIITIA